MFLSSFSLPLGYLLARAGLSELGKDCLLVKSGSILAWKGRTYLYLLVLILKLPFLNLEDYSLRTLSYSY